MPLKFNPSLNYSILNWLQNGYFGFTLAQLRLESEPEAVHIPRSSQKQEDKS